ncbi:MAG: terminase [Liquorilactobacillus hordei]|uniref:Prophage terminase small subunit n=1 Tax=Liquorilactobacillus satsumensis DSM 16230 = JCM 12392 TaxID=1423801 RepID=A0A0R1V539_9LACO|nr:terminase [Liquorilactobacillus satsumensis]KRL98037.1 prophage terminase small subunit [Liquorilactobacillus satsumensis DSM 16230 = JCM 12392]
MTKQEQAKKDYLSGMKYKDVATKYEVSINTVKSWKNRYGWQRGAPVKKSMHTKPKKGAYKKELNNGGLTPEQELFAQLVGGKRIPLYRAYQIAYAKTKPSVATAMAASSRLAKEPEITTRIVNISKETAYKHKWSLNKVVEGLSFVHDESKADMIEHGVKKSNADAMLEALSQLTDVLNLKKLDENSERKLKAEADIAEAKAHILNDKGDDTEAKVSKLLDKIDDAIEGNDNNDN